VKKKLFSAVLLGVTAFTLAACGGGSAKEERDEDTITFLRPDYSELRPKSEDLWMWQEYEEMTGVKVKWEELTDFGEKKNVILSRKTLPDAFYQTTWSNDELVKYGNQGLFIPLEDLIDEHAPNLKKVMDENPTIRKTLTSPDGHIYGLPYLSLDPMSGGRTFRLYINQTWLDALNLEKPKTTEELKEVLTQFVNNDPNGNGEKDEQGWYMNSGELPNSFEKIIMASYGLNTGGRKAIDNMIYLDDNKDLQLTISDDKMKEVWQYEQDLYQNNLIFKEAFAGVDYDKWVADAAQDKVGLWSWVSPELVGAAAMDNYTPINVLEGPNGDISLVTDPPVMGTSALVITKDAPDPAKIMEWVDFFYGPEGTEFGFLGKEGVTFNVVNGKKVYTDDILNYERGAQLGAFQKIDNVYGGFFPYLEPDQATKEIAMGLEPVVYDDVNEDVMPEEMLPEFMSTAEESAELSTIMTDLRKFVEQSRVKFLTGEWNFTTDWDSYKEYLNKIGAERMLEIRREQYKRFEGQ